MEGGRGGTDPDHLLTPHCVYPIDMIKGESTGDPKLSKEKCPFASCARGIDARLQRPVIAHIELV